MEAVMGKKGPSESQLEQCRSLLRLAKRPVLVLGFGVRLASATSLAWELINRLGIPVCPSWAAADMIPANHPLLASTFGTHGTRLGNFTVQNADLILAIGARLSTRETGSPLSWWAREASTIIVDIDGSELGKFPIFGKPLDLAIESDAKVFIEALLAVLTNEDLPDSREWVEQIGRWREQYPVCLPAYRGEVATNPYVFVEMMSRHLQDDEVIVVDTGCAVAWMMQGFKFKAGQRLLHAFNNTPMGYGLPGAIGAAFALGGKRRVICVTGDGSLMMNMQELATVKHHQLPIKLFLINNGGYSMVQQTQDQWLGGKYYASSSGKEGGLSFPDFNLLARSCGLDVTEIYDNKDVEQVIAHTLQLPGPVICNVHIASDARVIPQCKFGYPIEDSEPLLPRDEFLANMIVKPHSVSLQDKDV
jgi:acetolactate synthase-1/2/3 large subunit